MTCILRASGNKFDVDGFLAISDLVVDSFWRMGELKYSASNSIKKLNSTSGIRVVASEAGFPELLQQIDDAILFLAQNLEAVKTLTGYSGLDSAVLDFGAENHRSGWSSFTFPARLLSLAGSAGVSLCLSIYPAGEETES